jgi:sec-independent protein translocase protein TatA
LRRLGLNQMEAEMLPQIGVAELLIILLIVLFVFGAGKLPQIGKALGRGIREFREATQPGGEEGASGASDSRSEEA